MIFGEVDVADAAGTILAHSAIIGSARWNKGRRLDAADVTAARDAGIARLTVARLEAGDVAEDAAAARLGAMLVGGGIRALPAAHGRVNLAAAAAGLFRVDAAMVARVNAVDEALTLATLADHGRVAAGDIVATVKVIPYAVDAALLKAACAAARPLGVAPFHARRVQIIHTRVAATTDKVVARADSVTRGRLAALDCTHVTGGECAHEVGALAATIDPAGANLVLIVGASATADRCDVVPAAIVAAGGRIERLGMPVDPGNLLCLGCVGDTPVIGLPGCARSPKRNGFDWVLERLVAGLPMDGADIAAMGVGGLLAEAERPQPRAAAAAGTVGALVLAAGRSTRMGDAHKLLAELGGKPVVAHIVDALAAAGLPPPVVVLGARGEDVRGALGTRPARYVDAPDYADGLSRSLAAGIAALPAGWSSVLICLGDMPRVDAATMRALADSAGDVVVPTWEGKRGNPVRWSRRWFARLASLDGDIGGKALLSDAEVTEIAATDNGVLIDVDTPEALAALQENDG